MAPHTCACVLAAALAFADVEAFTGATLRSSRTRLSMVAASPEVKTSFSTAKSDAIFKEANVSASSITLSPCSKQSGCTRTHRSLHSLNDFV